ncbi:DNA-binding domain-containing protein [Legionella sp. PC997]|uniref:HvfC/BufC N-terminal domain-containing protein n=1 Tax=Legionella sp. PC997 TaxID=2755562 RepID=UPI0015F86AAD|nr:DNA-binding domain-containing protein [Legionella sp. PC997]
MKQESQLNIATIKQIQEDFTQAVYYQNDNELIEHISKNQLDPEFRLSIYRNNIMLNLCRALEITYPFIWKLIGEECAHQIARMFCQKEMNLPVTNCLDDWGANFPGFLQEINSIQHLVYLKDIAELEWLIHKSYRALDFKSLKPGKLQKKLEGSGDLRLVFNPSVHLFSSLYSLKEIIEFIEWPDGKKIDLRHIPSYAVIARQKSQVMTHWISKDLFDWLACLKNRTPLMHAYDHITTFNPDFDLVAGLEFILKNRLLWKCLS